MNKKSILLGLTLALVGCLPMGTSLAADTPHFKSNKAAAEYFWNEVFNKHDTAVIDTMVGPKYKQHSPEFADGKQAFKDGVTDFLKAYPDSSAVIKHIGADGDLVVTLTGQNSVREMQTSIVDISQCGLEVWGNLTLRGTGSLTATGSQCGVHAFQALVVDGCTVNAQADGAGIEDEVVAGLVAGRLVVRGGGRVVAAGAGSGAGVRAYGAYLLDEDPGDGVPFGSLAVDASWLDATGADGGVGCLAGSLTSARFVAPAGGTFGARGVVDTAGAVSTHVVIEPDDATPPAGETDARDVLSDGGKPASGTDHAAGESGSGTAARPEVKPCVSSRGLEQKEHRKLSSLSIGSAHAF